MLRGSGWQIEGQCKEQGSRNEMALQWDAEFEDGKGKQVGASPPVSLRPRSAPAAGATAAARSPVGGSGLGCFSGLAQAGGSPRDPLM